MNSKYNELCGKLIAKNTKETTHLVEASPSYGQALGGVAYKAGRWARYVFFVKRFIKKCKQEIIDLQRKCEFAHSQGVRDRFQFEVEMNRDIEDLNGRISDWIKLVKEFILLPNAKTHKAELDVLKRYVLELLRNCVKKQKTNNTVDVDSEVMSGISTQPSTTQQDKLNQGIPTVRVPSYTHRQSSKNIGHIPTDYVQSYTHNQKPKGLGNSRQARQLK